MEVKRNRLFVLILLALVPGVFSTHLLHEGGIEDKAAAIPRIHTGLW